MKLSTKRDDTEAPQKRIVEPVDKETPLDVVRKKTPPEEPSCEAVTGVVPERKVDE